MTRRCTIGLIAATLLAVAATSSVWADSGVFGAACDQGDVSACNWIIDDVLADGHDRVAASLKRGLLNRHRGDRDLAVADFRRAISLDHGNGNVSLSNRCLAIAKNDDKGLPVFTYAIADSGSPAEKAAIDRCEQQAGRQNSSLRCSVADVMCDGWAGLPAALRPDKDRPCSLGEQVTISGIIQDVAQEQGTWSAGTIARADVCRGMIDIFTGFAALFGDGPRPPGCTAGRRFLASGAAASGFQPEFFLKVRSIKCD